MRGIVLRWIFNAVALYVIAYLVEGIRIESFGAALVAMLVWGILNAFIRPFINLLTLPVNVLTLGLFTFVVNGFLLWLVADSVERFYVDSIWIGILAAFILSLASSVFSAVIDN